MLNLKNVMHLIGYKIASESRVARCERVEKACLFFKLSFISDSDSILFFQNNFFNVSFKSGQDHIFKHTS